MLQEFQTLRESSIRKTSNVKVCKQSSLLVDYHTCSSLCVNISVFRITKYFSCRPGLYIYILYTYHNSTSAKRGYMNSPTSQARAPTVKSQQHLWLTDWQGKAMTELRSDKKLTAVIAVKTVDKHLYQTWALVPKWCQGVSINVIMCWVSANYIAARVRCLYIYVVSEDRCDLRKVGPCWSV